MTAWLLVQRCPSPEDPHARHAATPCPALSSPAVRDRRRGRGRQLHPDALVRLRRSRPRAARRADRRGRPGRPHARADGRARARGPRRLHRPRRAVRQRGDQQRPVPVGGRRPGRQPDRPADDRDGGRRRREPAAGGQRGAHRRGDRAAPSGPSPRRRAAAGRRPRGRVRLRLRARPAHPERDREHRPVPGRPALPAVVAGHRRGGVRAAGRLRQRARARHRARRAHQRGRGAAGHRLPRLADVRGLHHRLPGGHRAARNRPGRARLHLRRQRRVRRDGTVRVPARRLPPGSALAAQRRHRVRRPRRGLPARQQPGPPAARPRDLARRVAGRAGRRGPAAPGRTPPHPGPGGADLRDAGHGPPAPPARPQPGSGAHASGRFIPATRGSSRGRCGTAHCRRRAGGRWRRCGRWR
jgi:hypothetical protein